MKIKIDDWTKFNGENFPTEFGTYIVTTVRGVVRILKYQFPNQREWLRNVTAWTSLPKPFQK